MFYFLVLFVFNYLNLFVLLYFLLLIGLVCIRLPIKMFCHINSLCYFVTGTMAVPPTYADLGKSAKDIFSKGYGKWKKRLYIFLMIFHGCIHLLTSRGLGGLFWNVLLPKQQFPSVFDLVGFGLVKLDVKTKSPSGVVSLTVTTHVQQCSVGIICSF